MVGGWDKPGRGHTPNLRDAALGSPLEESRQHRLGHVDAGHRPELLSKREGEPASAGSPVQCRTSDGVGNPVQDGGHSCASGLVKRV